jgi:hypothetical protein
MRVLVSARSSYSVPSSIAATFGESRSVNLCVSNFALGRSFRRLLYGCQLVFFRILIAISEALQIEICNGNPYAQDQTLISVLNFRLPQPTWLIEQTVRFFHA